MNIQGELTPKARNAKWNYIRRQLKEEFEAQGITACELCGSTFALSFAHRLKRRFVTTIAELKTVCLLCQTCHQRIEVSGHEQMYEVITTLITQRSVQ